MDKKLLSEMDAAYSRLEMKRSQVVSALFQRMFKLESGWYNGHYHKDDGDQWIRESYPIPVIGVKGLCDVEIQFDKLSVSTKLKRDMALDHSFQKFSAHEFEAYGVEDYLADFYHPGQTIEQMKEKIQASEEAEIGFSFAFPFEVDGKQLFEFVKLLRHEGFYY